MLIPSPSGSGEVFVASDSLPDSSAGFVSCEVEEALPELAPKKGNLGGQHWQGKPDKPSICIVQI